MKQQFCRRCNTNPRPHAKHLCNACYEKANKKPRMTVQSRQSFNTFMTYGDWLKKKRENNEVLLE
jgi:NMD protein affecting ribosome stability and mRNA decay